LRQWSQLSLRQIRYVDYPGENGTKFLISVDFEYEDLKALPLNKLKPGAAPFSDHRAGFEIRTRKRCRRISLHKHCNNQLRCILDRTHATCLRSTTWNRPKNPRPVRTAR
jgi:hypothetical protein